MATNIHVEKVGNENTAAVLRKFTQRMRSAGLVQKMRKIRYRSRTLSPLEQRKERVRKIARREEFEQLIKDGKISESVRGRRGKAGKVGKK